MTTGLGSGRCVAGFILTIRPLGNPVINSINIGRDMTVIFGQVRAGNPAGHD